MISTLMLSRFSVTRALIYASSPQVTVENDTIVIISETGTIAERVARLAAPDSFDRLRKAIFVNPLSISLVELPDRFFHERYAIAERVSIYHAFMLT